MSKNDIYVDDKNTSKKPVNYMITLFCITFVNLMMYLFYFVLVLLLKIIGLHLVWVFIYMYNYKFSRKLVSVIYWHNTYIVTWANCWYIIVYYLLIVRCCSYIAIRAGWGRQSVNVERCRCYSTLLHWRCRYRCRCRCCCTRIPLP